MPSPLAMFTPCHERTVITGGGSGIGRALALALAELGGTVYVMGRRRGRLEETASLRRGQDGRIVPVVCDIRDWTSVDAAFRQVESDGGPAPALAHAASEVDHMLA